MKADQSPLAKPIKVINIGLESFAEDLSNANIPVIQMDWRPPAGGDPKLIALLDRLAEEI
jgi:FdrA protein